MKNSWQPDKTEIECLIKAAREAKEYALAFKSKHSIGAAVLTKDGKIFEGTNIDGIISSQGICAEMAAINHAVVHNQKMIRAVCVYDVGFTYPCGVCLQYMAQFEQISGRDVTIIVAKEGGDWVTKSAKELLPKRYESKNFQKDLKNYAKQNQ
ncbi:MAG: cytidine deaminase [Candidatus Shapirobacteria bacterium]|jgi:cytidine deaminase